jgi:hypothetical protein
MLTLIKADIVGLASHHLPPYVSGYNDHRA